MLSRWIVITFALVPVVFIPTCTVTHSVMIWRDRTPVQGQVTAEFPVLQISGPLAGRIVEIVPLTSTHPGSLFVAPNEQPVISSRVKRMPETGLAREDQHMGAEVDFQNLRNGLQRVHVSVRHEVAMGFIKTESWYDTDGKTIKPRYERQYAPSWMFLGSCVVAAPASFVVAGVLSGLLLALVRRRALPTVPSPKPLRVLIAGLVALAAAGPFAAEQPRLLLAVPILIVVVWAVSAFRWTQRRVAVAILLLIAIHIAVAIFVPDWVVFVAVMGELAIGCALAVTVVIERSLSAAWWQLIRATPALLPS